MVVTASILVIDHWVVSWPVSIQLTTRTCIALNLQRKRRLDTFYFKVVETLRKIRKKLKLKISNLYHYLAQNLNIIGHLTLKCNRCVTFDHGPDCTPEQVNYNFDIVDDEVQCTDPAGTCPNAICQCDKDMITGFKDFLDIYNPSYSAFAGGFDSMTQCEVSSIFWM